MKRSIVSLLVVSILAAPALAHGGRGGVGGFGGGGFSHASAGGGFHAPTFSRPSTAGFRSAAPHAAPAFGGHAAGFAGPGFAHPGAPGFAGRGFVNNRGFAGGPGFRGNYYGGWYHGNWAGNWGRPWGYWPVGWGGYWPGAGWGWGLGIGLGTGMMMGGMMAAGSPYNWGYYNYYNPYWGGSVAGASYINYSQPLVMAQPPAQTMVAGGAGPAAGYGYAGGVAPTAGYAGGPGASPQIGDFGREQFLAGDYQAALSQVNQALAANPKDPVLNEFRGLCLFALGQYADAAAADYAVLSVGPGWDWTTLSSFYPNVNVYTQQLRALEAYSQQHPTAADARFLLAYQYLREGYHEEAIAELRAVVQLQPRDELSAQMLRGLTTPANGTSGSQLAGGPAPAPEDFQGPQGVQAVQTGMATTPATPVVPGKLIGKWSASRDSSKFDLQLTEDHKFTWKFSTPDRQQTLTGTYTVADNYLILKGSDQNTLIGQVTPEGSNRFNFRMAGNNPADPGIDFSR